MVTQVRRSGSSETRIQYYWHANKFVLCKSISALQLASQLPAMSAEGVLAVGARIGDMVVTNAPALAARPNVVVVSHVEPSSTDVLR